LLSIVTFNICGHWAAAIAEKLRVRRLSAFLVSGLLLALIYWRVDVSNIFNAAREANWTLLVSALGFGIPLVCATAARFSILVGDAEVGIAKSLRMVLLASTLNLFLPSKMGDIAKAAVLVDEHGMDLKFALTISIFDKVLDVLSVLFLGVAALFLITFNSGDVLWVLATVSSGLFIILFAFILPLGLSLRAARLISYFSPTRISAPLLSLANSWHATMVWFWRDRNRAVVSIGISIAIWCGHLMQFWLLAYSLGAKVPILENMEYASLSILAGLLPFTLAGIGSRDAAIIYFYSAYLTPAQGALLGILATLRYILVALAGLPFLVHFVHNSQSAGKTVAYARGWLSREGPRQENQAE